MQLQAQCPPGATGAAAAGAKSAKAAKRQHDAGKPGHQGDTADTGATVQLAKLWFVRLGERLEGGGGFKTRTAHELPRDLSLLPSLLR